MRVICPRRRLNPAALVSSGGGTLPGRLYDTVSLHTGPHAAQGGGRCCKWLSELTDGSPSSLHSAGSVCMSGSTLCCLDASGM
ncbi:hypothetical protein PBY51_022203 [Eleginops maclovinus]|uniref:Uncharacterized protein n=1 Tax=Eleginops maclovinus TaxID=56733 RepID=A0AAN8AI41_ELEMC|nr:hypothetical protein PBY51_022203 [Eleginops maclovinus]